MLAAFVSNQGLQILEIAQPQPGPGEALVQILLAGICATDLELLAGYHNFQGILGHEFVGRVVKAPNHPELIGQRVVGDINCGCGSCAWCLQGNARHCPHRSVLGIKGQKGAFARYVALPASNLHLVPDSVQDQEAVWAEPLAAALQVSQQVHISAKNRVAVLGDGKLGLLCALVLTHCTADVVLIGRHAKKLELAKAKGLHTVLCPAGQPCSETLPGFDLVVECTGRPQGIQSALDLVRAQGTVLLKTTCRQQTSLDLAQVVVNEINLLGSRCGDLRLALHFLARQWIDVLPLVQAVFGLSEARIALEQAGQPGAMKVLLDCSA